MKTATGLAAEIELCCATALSSTRHDLVLIRQENAMSAIILVIILKILSVQLLYSAFNVSPQRRTLVSPALLNRDHCYHKISTVKTKRATAIAVTL